MKFSPMDSQNPALWKRFVTKLATKWFITCMRYQMSVKLTFIVKSFTALWTAEQLGIIVSRHILFICIVSVFIIPFMPVPENTTNLFL
jgi:hypothetical protein